MRANRELRQQVIDISHALHDRGWVANHDGNITVRLASDRFLATPTATSKRAVDAKNLIEVDGQGKRVSGTARPFSELNLHFAVYSGRDDINAVVHAHPPHATALACSGSRVLERPFIAEAVVSIGATVPLVPFAVPGPAAREALASVVGDVDAALMENHGVIAWGADLEQAYLRLELVEHLARIATIAQPGGGVQPLPEAAVTALLQKRAKSGLGKAAEKAAGGKAVIACAPAPHSSVRTVALTKPSSELSKVVREEIVRALREHGGK